MKIKPMLQVLVLLALLFSPFGGVQVARASSNLAEPPGVSIVTRDISVWNATYYGYVNATTYERWQFDFTETHNFVVTVSPVYNTMVPVIVLLDGTGAEITRATRTLTTTQPAGSYSVQIQPELGSDFYFLTLREIAQPTATPTLEPTPTETQPTPTPIQPTPTPVQPYVTTALTPASINVGETAVATISLGNVPAEGYTSVEFVCTYNATQAEVSNIVVNNLFGPDPAVASTLPQNGSFIVAIAGSNGGKATTSGAAFIFNLKGLEAGQGAVECIARVSTGNGTLTSILSTPASLTVSGSTATPTPIESPTPTVTTTPIESPTPTTTPAESPTPTTTPDGSVTPEPPTATPTETGTPEPTTTATPVESPTPTATANPTDGTFTGKVLASKPVVVSLLNADDSVAASVVTNADGSFSLTAPAGTYTATATSIGFLGAEASVTLTGGGTVTQPDFNLLAGDIDNNNVIDQFDAMTIGMNYNTATPPAADLNTDGVINVLDLELLARNYRLTGPVTWQ